MTDLASLVRFRLAECGELVGRYELAATDAADLRARIAGHVSAAWRALGVIPSSAVGALLRFGDLPDDLAADGDELEWRLELARHGVLAGDDRTVVASVPERDATLAHLTGAALAERIRDASPDQLLPLLREALTRSVLAPASGAELLTTLGAEGVIVVQLGQILAWHDATRLAAAYGEPTPPFDDRALAMLSDVAGRASHTEGGRRFLRSLVVDDESRYRSAFEREGADGAIALHLLLYSGTFDPWALDQISTWYAEAELLGDGWGVVTRSRPVHLWPAVRLADRHEALYSALARTPEAAFAHLDRVGVDSVLRDDADHGTAELLAAALHDHVLDVPADWRRGEELFREIMLAIVERGEPAEIKRALATITNLHLDHLVPGSSLPGDDWSVVHPELDEDVIVEFLDDLVRDDVALGILAVGMTGYLEQLVGHEFSRHADELADVPPRFLAELGHEVAYAWGMLFEAMETAGRDTDEGAAIFALAFSLAWNVGVAAVTLPGGVPGALVGWPLSQVASYLEREIRALGDAPDIRDPAQLVAGLAHADGSHHTPLDWMIADALLAHPSVLRQLGVPPGGSWTAVRWVGADGHLVLPTTQTDRVDFAAWFDQLMERFPDFADQIHTLRDPILTNLATSAHLAAWF